MKIRYVVFLVLSVALILITMIISGGADALVFFDLPSIIVVLGLAVFLSFTSFGFREIVSYFQAAIGKGTAGGRETETIRKAVVYFGTLQRYLVLTAIIGPMVGIITVLSNLEDMSAVGRGIAMALLTALYSAILIAFVAIPFHAAARKRLAETGIPVGESV